MKNNNEIRYEMYGEGFSKPLNLNGLMSRINYKVDISDYIPINKLGINKSKEDLN